MPLCPLTARLLGLLRRVLLGLILLREEHMRPLLLHDPVLLGSRLSRGKVLVLLVDKHHATLLLCRSDGRALASCLADPQSSAIAPLKRSTSPHAAGVWRRRVVLLLISASLTQLGYLRSRFRLVLGPPSKPPAASRPCGVLLGEALLPQQTPSTYCE